MRKTLCASALVLALCGSAFAGDMNCPPLLASGDIDNPPPASEEISNPPNATRSFDEQTADGFAAGALGVINTVLALS
jgi:hypothetical protein